MGYGSLCSTKDVARKLVQEQIDGAKIWDIVSDTGGDCVNRYTIYKPIEVVFTYDFTTIVKCIEYYELPGVSIAKREVYLINIVPVIGQTK